MAKASKVALDSNMLMNIKRFKVDVFWEARKMLGNVEFVVPKQVIQEMEALGKRSLALRKEASVARELLERNNTKVVEVEARGADEALEKLASEAIIATNDKELKASVKELNGRVLYLRQKKFLELS